MNQQSLMTPFSIRKDVKTHLIVEEYLSDLKNRLDEFLEKNNGAEILSLMHSEQPRVSYILIIYRTNDLF